MTKEEIIALKDEILTDIRIEQEEADKILNNLLDLAFNENNVSKPILESITTMISNKANISERKTRILDVLTKIYFKESFDSNSLVNKGNIQINNVTDKRELLKAISDSNKELRAIDDKAG